MALELRNERLVIVNISICLYVPVRVWGSFSIHARRFGVSRKQLIQSTYDASFSDAGRWLAYQSRKQNNGTGPKAVIHSNPETSQ